MIAGELFSIQSIRETGSNLIVFRQHFQNLYKHRQVYRTSPSPNKGSISLYTFQLRRFLLYHSVSLVSGSFSLSSLRSASDNSTY